MKYGIVFLQLILLSACGGGSNSGSTGNGTSIPFPYTLDTEPATYEGNTDAAALRGDDLWPYINYLLLDNVVIDQTIAARQISPEISRITSALSRVRSFTTTPPQGTALRTAARIDACTVTGTVNIEIQPIANGQVIVAEFDNCYELVQVANSNSVNDFEMTHGKVTIIEESLSEHYTFENLNLQSRNTSYTYSGTTIVQRQIACLGETSEFNLAIRNNNLNETVKTESLVFSQRCENNALAIEGRFFHPIHGYIDVSTPVTMKYQNFASPYPSIDGELVFTGRSNRKFRLQVTQADFLQSTSQTVISDQEKLRYLLSLDRDGNGVYEHQYSYLPADFLNETGANLLDTDNDGMPDGYEILKEHDPQVHDASGDDNHNGLINYEEFLYQHYGVNLHIDSSYFNYMNIGSHFGFPDYPQVRAGQEVEVSFTLINGSTYIRAKDVAVTFRLSAFGPAQVLTEDCETLSASEIRCLIGDMDPQQQIHKTLRYTSDSQNTVVVSANIESLSMGESYAEEYQVYSTFSNRVARLILGTSIETSYLNEPSEGSIFVTNLGSFDSDEARNPVLTLTVPEQISVNSISVNEYSNINGVVNRSHIGNCIQITQPIITCNLQQTIQKNSTIELLINHTGLAQGIFTIDARVDSDADRYPNENRWQLSKDIRVANSLVPIQSQINDALDGDTIVIPDGEYSGALDFLGKNIRLTSQNGPENTSLFLVDGGIILTNGGEVNGFEFLSSVTGINISGGNAFISNNIIRNHLSLWLISENANLDITRNLFEGRQLSLAAGCGFFATSSLLLIVNPDTLSITNNKFINAAWPGLGCPVITYMQDDGPLGITDLSLGLISNNLFYSDNPGPTSLYIRTLTENNSLYLQNNIYHSTATYRRNLSLFVPNIRFNLFFGQQDFLSEMFYDFYGDAWLSSIDPLFSNSAIGDFHLLAGSPAIDAGVSEHAPTVDFQNLPRPIDGNGDLVNVPDIGPYEFSP